MEKIKKILWIIFFSSLIFWWYKSYWYLEMIPEFETKINSQIAEINNQVNSIKPEIKKIEKQVGDMLETVEFLSKWLLAFWEILDKTILSLDWIWVTINDFDLLIESINPTLNTINENLDIATVILKENSPSLKVIENTIKSINFKIAKLEMISARKKKLLEQLMKQDINSLNKIMYDKIKNQKILENTIIKSKKILKQIEKVIPVKKVVPIKKVIPVQNIIKKNIPKKIPDNIKDTIPDVFWF